MKYRRRLEASVPPDFRNHTISYKSLKQAIKAERSGQHIQDRQRFPSLLQWELNEISCCFTGAIAHLEEEIAEAEQRADASHTLSSNISLVQAVERINAKVNDLTRYCVLHYIATLKLVKKWNKHVPNQQLYALLFLLQEPFFVHHNTALQPLVDTVARLRQVFALQVGYEHGVPGGERMAECSTCSRSHMHLVVLSCNHVVCWGCVAGAASQEHGEVLSQSLESLRAQELSGQFGGAPGMALEGAQGGDEWDRAGSGRSAGAPGGGGGIGGGRGGGGRCHAAGALPVAGVAAGQGWLNSMLGASPQSMADSSDGGDSWCGGGGPGGEGGGGGGAEGGKAPAAARRPQQLDAMTLKELTSGGGGWGRAGSLVGGSESSPRSHHSMSSASSSDRLMGGDLGRGGAAPAALPRTSSSSGGGAEAEHPLAAVHCPLCAQQQLPDKGHLEVPGGENQENDVTYWILDSGQQRIWQGGWYLY